MAAQTPVSGCSRHPGMGFVYVCKSCGDTLLCMECITDSHNGHTVGKLADYVAGQKQEIQKFVEKLSKTDIPKTKRDMQKNETTDGRYPKMIEEIKCRGEKMKHDIDNIVDMLVRMCTELKELNAGISQRNKTALNKHLKENLQSKLDRCQEVLTSGTTVDVTALAREIRTTSTPAPPTLERLQTVEFKPGTISTELLERMLGKLLVDEDRSYKPSPKCVVLSEFETSFHADSCCIRHTGDGAWLSCWNNERVARVDVNGNVKEKIKCKVKVQSISVSPITSKVWFCVKDDRSVREIRTGGGIVTHFNVDNIPRSLCITSENMIVVGMTGGIQLYTTDGRAVSAGAGGLCRQAAVVPHHMTSCTLTGHVAAVDKGGVISYDDYMAGKEPDKQPCVIMMDKHLNLKFHIKDNGTSKSQGSDIQSLKFAPYDVCFDGTGDVLVADFVTKSVLLIDIHTGHYMRTIYTSDGSAPMCISLHEDNILWVGHRNSRMKIMKYKYTLGLLDTTIMRLH